MDTNLQGLLDSIMREEGVKGVLVTDNQGLCLATRGTAPLGASGFVAAVADRALELSSTITTTAESGQDLDQQSPTICIETGNDTYPFTFI
ncbi:hypothetical protein BDF22DRAFT_742708 [Syncephalis plumigaleata]|nr:hypothetical protein BDF22DRAFT_742708 [Syncephalis plumigaleata]